MEIQEFYGRHEISVKGRNAQKPILTFSEAHFPGDYYSELYCIGKAVNTNMTVCLQIM